MGRISDSAKSAAKKSAGAVGRGAGRAAKSGAAANGRGTGRLAKRSVESGYDAGRRRQAEHERP
jgi:hypothetical protein